MTRAEEVVHPRPSPAASSSAQRPGGPDVAGTPAPPEVRRDDRPAGQWWRPRWADLALFAVAVGVLLRVVQWRHSRPLWLDEQFLALNLRDRDLGGLVGQLGFNQSAPLGWLWTMSIITDLIGTSERQLRLMPMAFGVATLLVGWWIGRRWLGPLGSVTLVSLLAITPQIVYYSNELKQYSADVCLPLLLLGLAGWAAEPGRRVRPVWRLATWWSVAAGAAWFSMAAVLVVPALSIVLVGVLLRRDGVRTALGGALTGVVWLASFAAHYLLSLRYAVGDAGLLSYWRAGFPPSGGGIGGAAGWLADMLPRWAADPMGVTSWSVFWMVVLGGLVLLAAARPIPALLVAGVPAMAVALALAGVVPLAGRLGLWVVPALYLLVAAAVDVPARWAWRRLRDRPMTPRRVVTAVAAGLVAVTAAAGTAVAAEPMGLTSLAEARVPRAGIDDRGAIGWVSAQRRPGDVVLVRGLSWPAARWYGDPDGLEPSLVVALDRPGAQCDPTAFPAAVDGYTRAILYVGFRSGGEPNPTPIITARLRTLGAVVETRNFRGVEIVVVDLTATPTPTPTPTPAPAPAPAGPTTPAADCVRVLPKPTT